MKNIENTAVEASNKLNKESVTLEEENQLLKQENEELKAKNKFYEEQFRLNQQQKFGSSSEKIIDGQVSMFNEAEKESVKESKEPVLDEITYKRKKASTKSRKTYDDLEVEEIYYELTDEEKVCPNCDGSLHEMKTEIRKELKIIPPQAKLVHHIRQVYACRSCEENDLDAYGTIITSSMPKPVIPGSMVSPSLLATIMDMKYNKMMPLYRQEQSFVDYGIDISRQNLASWVIKGADRWLKPLCDRMHYHILKEDIIHADETVLNVLDEKDNKNNYMWLYASGERANHRIYLYDYQKSRSQKHPKTFLDGFSGYLQTDGYQGYNSVNGVKNLGCLAHARRKFTDAIKAAPVDSDIVKTKSSKALEYFSKIYAFEKEFKDLGSSQRYESRLSKTKPVLDELHVWLLAESKKTLPKSKLGEAIKYSLRQWDKLIVFLEDARLSVDNNLAERGIKPFVLGRKNFLFSKSPLGATASGLCYSIIETAKANNLIPFKYLTYLFEKLPNIDLENFDELDALLPWADEIPHDIKKKDNE